MMKHHEDCPCNQCTIAHREAGCQCPRCYVVSYNPNVLLIPTTFPINIPIRISPTLPDPNSSTWCNDCRSYQEDHHRCIAMPQG